MNETHDDVKTNKPIEESSASNFLLILVAIAILLVILFVILILCVKCKYKNRSILFFFVSCVTCSKNIELKVKKYLDQFIKLSTQETTQDEEIKIPLENDHLKSTAAKDQKNQIDILKNLKKSKELEKQTEPTVENKIKSIASTDPNILKPLIKLKFKTNVDDIKASLEDKIMKALQKPEEKDGVSLKFDKRKTKKSQIQIQTRSELLKDEKVRLALKKIQDLAEKERSKSAKKRREFNTQSNEDDAKSIKSKRKSKRSFKASEEKKASTTILAITKKFEELNQDLKKILQDKKK